MSMPSLAGTRVLVTGAAMGLGRIFAERAVSEGAAAVVLWDIDVAALEATAAALREHSSRTAVHAYVVDLSRRAAITTAAARVRAEVGDIDVLFNNAGVIRGAQFWDHSLDDIELTMAVNALAPMFVTREFLPAMIAGGRESRIVTIASAAGLLSNPRMSVYCGSKWAATGWSDSVRLELELAGHHHVRVTTVNPTYIATGMFAGAGSMLLTPLMTPAYVTGKVWRAMLDGRPRLLLPWTVHLSSALRGLLPLRLFDWLSLHVFGIYKSMDTFTGRSAT